MACLVFRQTKFGICQDGVSDLVLPTTITSIHFVESSAASVQSTESSHEGLESFAEKKSTELITIPEPHIVESMRSWYTELKITDASCSVGAGSVG